MESYRPCAYVDKESRIQWCVALADEGSTKCVVHRVTVFRPSAARARWSWCDGWYRSPAQRVAQWWKDRGV